MNNNTDINTALVTQDNHLCVLRAYGTLARSVQLAGGQVPLWYDLESTTVAEFIERNAPKGVQFMHNSLAASSGPLE